MHRHRDRGRSADNAVSHFHAHIHTRTHTEAVCIDTHSVTHSAAKREVHVARARAHGEV
jgi:hypothetical protein